MVVIVIIAFAICWTPLQVSLVLYILQPRNSLFAGKWTSPTKFVEALKYLARNSVPWGVQSTHFLRLKKNNFGAKPAKLKAQSVECWEKNPCGNRAGEERVLDVKADCRTGNDGWVGTEECGRERL